MLWDIVPLRFDSVTRANERKRQWWKFFQRVVAYLHNKRKKSLLFRISRCERTIQSIESSLMSESDIHTVFESWRGFSFNETWSDEVDRCVDRVVRRIPSTPMVVVHGLAGRPSLQQEVQRVMCGSPWINSPKARQTARIQAEPWTQSQNLP